MPTIERIEKSKHKRERVLVFLQEGELLRITQQELLRFGLCRGMTLSDEEVAALRAAADRSQTRAEAAALAARQMLSKKELCRRLEKKGAAQEAAAETADWLEELGAVDDAAFAGVIARHYGALGYGARRVQQELQRRGIPRELWEEALRQLPPPQEAIAAYLQGKLRGGALDDAAAKKLSDALRRRGFSWSDIRPALNALGQEIDED